MKTRSFYENANFDTLKKNPNRQKGGLQIQHFLDLKPRNRSLSIQLQGAKTISRPGNIPEALYHKSKVIERGCEALSFKSGRRRRRCRRRRSRSRRRRCVESFCVLKNSKTTLKTLFKKIRPSTSPQKIDEARSQSPGHLSQV